MTDAKEGSTAGALTARMSGALAAVANGATVRSAAEAHEVSVEGLYKAMARHGVRGKDRCPTCGRLKPANG